MSQLDEGLTKETIIGTVSYDQTSGIAIFVHMEMLVPPRVV